jgi:hypothetical protein
MDNLDNEDGQLDL